MRQRNGEFLLAIGLLMGLLIVPLVLPLIRNGNMIPVGSGSYDKELSIEDLEDVLSKGLGVGIEKLAGDRQGEELSEDHIIETENGEKIIVTQHSLNHALEQNGAEALKCFAQKSTGIFMPLSLDSNYNDKAGMFQTLKNFFGRIMNEQKNKTVEFCGFGNYVYARIANCVIISGVKVKVIQTIMRYTDNAKGRTNLMKFLQDELQDGGKIQEWNKSC